NCLLGRVVAGHGHEREAARAAGVTVEDDLDVGHFAALAESCLDGVIGGVERQIAYVQSITHCRISLSSIETRSLMLRCVGSHVNDVSAVSLSIESRDTPRRWPQTLRPAHVTWGPSARKSPRALRA